MFNFNETRFPCSIFYWFSMALKMKVLLLVASGAPVRRVWFERKLALTLHLKFLCALLFVFVYSNLILCYVIFRRKFLFS